MNIRNTTVDALIRSEYISAKRFNVDYWSARHNPESDYHLGIDPKEKLKEAHEELSESRRATIEDIKECREYSIILRGAMRKLYLQAQDFCENPYIKIGNLRAVVIMRQMLNEYSEEYKPYSTKYLINVR
jgi:hypothetical protein